MGENVESFVVDPADKSQAAEEMQETKHRVKASTVAVRLTALPAHRMAELEAAVREYLGSDPDAALTDEDLSHCWWG
jgi:hypothetical protein